MSEFRFETLQLHVGQEQPDPATDSRAVPIYQTTSYVFRNSQHAADRFGLADAGNIYGRLTNSTQDVLEKRIAALEGGSAALAVASGAAAISYTIEALAANGGHIVAQKTIYGGSYNLLAHTLTQYGVSTTFVDAHNLEEVKAAIQDDTRAIYLETLGNPNADLPNIDAIAEIAHAFGLPVVVDNTFGTPYLFRPFEHGADIVVHSATKFIGGHGTTLGGIIVESGKFNWKASGKYGNISDPNPSYHGVSFYDAVGSAAFVTYIRAILLRDTGATISPFNAFLLLQGTETLSLRLERHAGNTKRVVEFLKNHPKVAKVNHPSIEEHPDHELYEKYFPNGGASIFTFDIKGGKEEAWKFIDNLEIFSLLANVADVKSLVIHPASTTHSQLTNEELVDQGIKQSTIRLSIGTEHIDDIIADLEKGFASI
ncbi:O-acetylhomoserine aminocarboxypropyltransferase/cysteine synthase family protein [[Clostridium] scindens]|uniref:O-acetylhomoserine aminocarboxypropyltransferase/cysteine synthase family protein n=1 Tax=Clostridium scindens (strain JCM 10418 / VPI 12708) TaxID=29347 RepID=UPI00298CF059|nr:O-acetylhomoserine aminocarboxypropyltransferase/cysteine synthase family protein [[Clostridium] scindens]WPB39461.1 O-acetyl-L-homoserine sulfhydrylase [[Clostridium] scindens]